MHVAIATPAFPLPRSGRNAGIERLSKELVDGLLARGHEVTVLTTLWNGGETSERYKDGWIFRVGDTSTTFGRWGALADAHYWSWGFRIGRVLSEDVRPDVVHALTPLASTSSLTKGKLPIVTTFHHPDEIWRLQDLLHRPFHRILESTAYARSTLLVTPSEASARAVEAQHEISRERIRVAYWGVNVTKFRPGSRGHRPELAILYVGHHELRKGIGCLLDAVARLSREGIPVRLTTVGGGHQLADLKRMARELGIADRVTFLGYLPDPTDEKLPELYSQSDVFVFPSLMEGFGFVIVEAMACGVPVVASDVSAIPEVIGDAGLLFEPGNPVALARVLRSLAEDPGKREELARKGRERVAALFTWDKAITRLVSIYREAIALGGRPS